MKKKRLTWLLVALALSQNFVLNQGLALGQSLPLSQNLALSPSLAPSALANGRSSKNVSQIVVDHCTFTITIEPGTLQVSRQDIDAYIRDAARAVVAYYGSFPVPQTVVKVTPSDDDGVGFATSTHEDDEGHGLIEIRIGSNTTRKDLAEDWTMTHEMMHLAFPIVEHKRRWIAEGIATYIEPIGRMRIGKLTREEMWGDLARNFHKGLPGTDGGGMNSAGGFRRIYWGGALYCLLADIEIRKRTKNRMGLEHALRAIANRGGTAASDWSAMKALKTGDEALGLTVLQELYDLMAERPASVDIDALVQKLGIERQGRKTYLNDDAPLAHIRRGIERSSARE